MSKQKGESATTSFETNGVKATEARQLGLDTTITRRDFVGTTLLGAGAALLGMAAPATVRRASAQTIAAPLTGLGPEWTGYGGIGDYARSNGNTHEVVNATHAGVRARQFDGYLSTAADTGESYDVIIVGAGISGLTAAHAYQKSRPNAKVLLLETHAMFGGEAKHNEFEVDGYRLWAPQGSGVLTQTVNPRMAEGYDFSDGYNIKDLYTELGFPDKWEFQQANGLTKKDLLFDTMPWFSMMGYGPADTGFFHESKGWVNNPWNNDFAGAPFSQKLKDDLIKFRTLETLPYRPDWRQWLDSMSVEDYLTKVMGLSSEFVNHVNPSLGVTNGLGADANSAYGVVTMSFWQQFESQERERGIASQADVPCPGALGPRHCPHSSIPLPTREDSGTANYVTLPGGNAGVARALARKLVPSAFPGSTVTDAVLRTVDFAALDRPNQPVRIRLESSVLSVQHEGSAGSSKGVRVHYLRNGKLFSVRGKTAIVASPQHVAKHVCRDIPAAHREAMETFAHGPVVTVNVALKNWKFMDKLGISAARWFDGFGWFTSINRGVIIDGKEPMPLDPSKPVVLTLYIPFAFPGLPYKTQATAARMQLFGMSYADIEIGIRRQFNAMFSSAGFDAKRDIAGIVANRWGHAYSVQYPGFYFGIGGKPSASSVIRQRHDRIAFAHSELQGTQTWPAAAIEGSRAARQALEAS